MRRASLFGLREGAGEGARPPFPADPAQNLVPRRAHLKAALFLLLMNRPSPEGPKTLSEAQGGKR